MFFGDMGGNLYAVDVATGVTSIVWPTKVATAKIVILGSDEPRPVKQ